jgi:hypothetical protein
MTSNTTIALIFILTLQMLMFFASTAMHDINPDYGGFYNLQGTILESAQKKDGSAGQYVMETSKVQDQLPQQGSSVAQTNGLFFTDIFGSIKTWFVSLPGVNYIYGIVTAPYNILALMNLPGEIVFGLGSLWYLVTFMIVIGWFWGRD